MKKVDVCLVDVPFSFLVTPIFSLSILKGCLNRAGIKSEVLYGGMMFSQRNYNDYVGSFQWLPQQTFVSDAVFAEAAWGREMADEYKTLLREKGIIAPPYMAVTAKVFDRLRKEAEPFIREFGDKILAKEPKIVAIASMFSQNNAAIALAKYLKSKSPSTVTMIGGANAVGESAWGLAKCPGCFDYVFSGEADEIFAEVCERIIRKGSIPKDELPVGVLTREMALDGKAVPIRHTVDLNTVPYPDFDDYFAQLKEYGLEDKVHPAIFMEFSRGCWWNVKHPCTFCGLNNGNHQYRIKKSERVLEELDYLVKRYGVDSIMVTDNILSAVHLKEVMPRIAERRENLQFFGEVKTNISDENIQDLARAGFVHIQPGIESLQDDVLSLMNKGATGIHQIAFLKRLMNEGIAVHWNIISGFPGEKPEYYEEMAEVVPLITHYMAPIFCSPLLFSRSSEYVEHPEKYGLKLKPCRFYEPCFPDKEFLRLTAFIYQPQDEEQTLLAEDITKVSPSHAKLKKWTDYWLYTTMNCPERLTAVYKDDVIEVMDMRQVAVNLFHTLKAAARAVALAAETEVKREAVVADLSGRYGKAEVETAIEWLKEKKLLLEMRGELLFLPTKSDAPPCPSDRSKKRGYLYEDPKPNETDFVWD